ncbi:hypothetical protein BU24DRAFT_434607 [Aaosphaeria arxii CBS 175.79]|uniref:5-Methylcytosine G/T mismatch-specific DNA glycosylase n=1 Tax=Aaosphaeria arxii CBS 175.79 TaxID=1450172 RepID=A0A6A5XMS0_9PLEO|nr:uncharacterized protein BU24DRAFT_434607 [Aaosphaeria arxii CBS 175.79]KAF2013634.1 hypothetical protein BU24DRAFT_434607 [Aaosphaeria arxii CBS 175.79]
MTTSSDTHSHRRRSKKDPDRERTRHRSKDRDREHDILEKSSRSKSSRKTTSTTSDQTEWWEDESSVHPREQPSKDRLRTPSTTASKAHKMAVVPELDRRESLGMGSRNGSRSSLSYPTLSKTHAKENIYSRGNEAPERKKSPFTPEPTDVDDDEQNRSEENSPNRPSRAPPSPPLTEKAGAETRQKSSPGSTRRSKTEALHKEMESGRRSVDSGTRLTSERRFTTASRSSVRHGRGDTALDETDVTSTTVSSQPSTVKGGYDKAAHLAEERTRQNSTSTARRSPSSRTKSRQSSSVSKSSDATQKTARRRHRSSPSHSENSPASAADSSPRTPTQHSVLPSVVTASKDDAPSVEIFPDPLSRSQSTETGFSSVQMPGPPPPPPPPPPAIVTDAPRVDYLLQHGGLARPVPRSLLAAIDNAPVTAYSHYTSPRVSPPQAQDVRAVFTPLQKLLDDYNKVIDTNGSLAVATGYRSVARRLLDRLEAVFARNISSENCPCIMCLDEPHLTQEEDGVNWGEILELVSGRCDLPHWPPLDNEPTEGLGIDLEDPCQKVDIDVPEEYRAHFARQSRKTKQSVQSWLSDQQESAPEEVDDETLTFAMLTRIEQEQRPLYYALLYGLDYLPNPRSNIEGKDVSPPAITKAALALQRLYRLRALPRNQLVVMYLIKNPDMHNILATLSAVTKQEWEILVSGRFDGFLWSGADDLADVRPGLSRNPSRGPGDEGPRRFASPGVPRGYTPFSPGPGSRPGSTRPGSTRPGGGGAPVQIDEDTEIAVLAEVEREIYSAMEAMEDAFEQLHNSAEVVRRRLRERGAALSMVAQSRRGSVYGGIEVRTDTPASFADVDSSLEDLRSEVGPDDSASNVGQNRRRRGHRSKARHTPAPVEEEDEGETSLAERIRRRL